MHPNLARLLQIQEPNFSRIPPGTLYPNRLIQSQAAYRNTTVAPSRLRPVLVDPYYLREELYPNARYALSEIARQGGVVRYYHNGKYLNEPPPAWQSTPTPTATLTAAGSQLFGADAQWFLADCGGIQKLLCAYRGQPALIEVPAKLIEHVAEQVGDYCDLSQAVYAIIRGDKAPEWMTLPCLFQVDTGSSNGWPEKMQKSIYGPLISLESLLPYSKYTYGLSILITTSLNISAHWPQLHYLNLEVIDPNAARILQPLLETMPQLERLDISSYQNLLITITLAPQSLLNLRTMTTSSRGVFGHPTPSKNLSMDSIQALLQAAPCLETIDLSGCENLQGNLILPPNSLPHLRTVQADSSNLSLANVQALLQAAPCLESLDLSGCTNLQGDLILAPNSLLHLRTLDVTGSNLSRANIQALRRAAPQLVEIKGLDTLPWSAAEQEGVQNPASQCQEVNYFRPLLEAAPRDARLIREQVVTAEAYLPDRWQLKPSPCVVEDLMEVASDPAIPDSAESFAAKLLPMHFNEGDELPLPSYTAQDRVTDITVTPADFRYRRLFSPRKGQYIFKADSAGSVTIGYTLHSPKLSVPGDLASLASQASELRKSDEVSCVERVNDHYRHIKFNEDQAWRKVGSSGHAFIEAYSAESQQWHVFDLGGSVPVGGVQHIDTHATRSVRPAGAAAAGSASGAAPAHPNSAPKSTRPTAAKTAEAKTSAPAPAANLPATAPPAPAAHEPTFVETVMGFVLSLFGALGGADPEPAERVPSPVAAPSTQNTTPSASAAVTTPTATESNESKQPTPASRLPTSQPSAAQSRRPNAPFQAPVIHKRTLLATDIDFTRSILLLETRSTEIQQNTLSTVLTQSALTRRPVFFINHPNDFLRFGPGVTYHQETASSPIVADPRSAGKPIGALGAFLSRLSAEDQPIIIVNLEHFTPADYAQYNALFEPNHPHWPANMTRVLIGQAGHYSQDPSFLRRIENDPQFLQKRQSSAGYEYRNIVQVNTPAVVEPARPLIEPTDSIVVDLQYRADWQGALLGQLICNETGHLEYQPAPEGLLTRLTVLQARPHQLIVQNPPPASPSWQRFCQLLQTQQCVAFENLTLALHPDTQVVIETAPLFTAEAVAKHRFMTQSRAPIQVPTTAIIVNQNTFYTLLQSSAFREGRYGVSKGVLEQRALAGATELALYCTDALPPSQWAQLLSEANRLGLSLQCCLLPGAELPLSLQSLSNNPPLSPRGSTAGPTDGKSCSQQVGPAVEPRDDNAIEEQTQEAGYVESKGQASEVADDCTELSPRVIIQEHPDAFTAALTEDAVHFILDDLDPNDFLEHVHAQWVDDALHGSYQLAPLYQAILDGKPIVLLGTPSTELANALMPLLLTGHTTLLNGEPLTLTAPLTIVTAQAPSGWTAPLAPCVSVYQASDLGANHSPPPTVKFTTDSDSDGFKMARLAAVRQALEGSSVIRLIGETGVGKTTFIEKELHLAYGCAPEAITRYPINQEADYNSVLKQWLSAAKADPTHNHVLVINEGNLTPRSFQQLQALLHDHLQTIVVEGAQYDISNYRSALSVIFTGNPEHYGHGRDRASQSLYHQATAVEFPLLPFAYIQDEMLAPLLTRVSSDDQDFVCSTLAALYQLAVARSQAGQALAITPRELAAIIQLTLATPEQHFDRAVFSDIVTHFAQSLLPDLTRAEQQQLGISAHVTPSTAIAFGAAAGVIALPKDTATVGNYQLLPSRQMAHLLLTRFLQQSHPAAAATPTSVQPKPGLAGCCLEGLAATGKSALVENTLKKLGYQRLSVEAATQQLPRASEAKADRDEPLKHYVHLPADASFEVREVVFNNALINGWAVWCDEFNSNYFDEKQLDHYLDQGLKLIITQNPANHPAYPGRHAFSSAMERRFLHVALAEYSEAEWATIHTGAKADDHRTAKWTEESTPIPSLN